MWYYAWVLGLGLTCCFTILCAIWFELEADKKAGKTVAE